MKNRFALFAALFELSTQFDEGSAIRCMRHTALMVPPAALSATVCATHGALALVVAVAVPVEPADAWEASSTPVDVPEPGCGKSTLEIELDRVPYSLTTSSGPKFVVTAGAVSVPPVPWPAPETSIGFAGSTPV